jgi:hypothetical protein
MKMAWLRSNRFRTPLPNSAVREPPLLSIFKRLEFDVAQDFKRLFNAFQEDPDFLVPSALEPCFTALRRNARPLDDSPMVLAMSFGGSTTSVMLARLKGGVPHIQHAVERRNPGVKVAVDEYFDDILTQDSQFSDYLNHCETPMIAIAIAVMVQDGVPYHPSKLATIDGLVAANPVTQAATHHLGRRVQAWLRSRRYRNASVVYEGDAPVAHLGAVGLTGQDECERSILMVCGNGMACADTKRFIVCGMHECLCEDDSDLYRPNECENGQYQYLIAGKGIYKVFRRAAAIGLGEKSTTTARLQIDRYFASDHDSKRVFELWSNDATPFIAELRGRLSEPEFEDLQHIAGAVVSRGVACIANSIVCTILHNGPSPDGRPYAVFLEGSIGTHRRVVNQLRDVLQDLCLDHAMFDDLGVPPPPCPRLVRNLPKAVPAPGVSNEALRRVDLTLIGALYMGAVSAKLENFAQ